MEGREKLKVKSNKRKVRKTEDERQREKVKRVFDTGYLRLKERVRQDGI